MSYTLIIQEGPECHCASFQNGESGPCVIHESLVEDKPPPVPLPRALTSLPDGLEFRTSSGGRTIFAKSEIPMGTVFGPLVGVLVKSKKCASLSKFAIGSKEEGWIDYWLDSDDLSNWMKYVRMQKDCDKQNLMAYQRNREVFFCATKAIHSGEELIAWYAKRYEEALAEAAALAKDDGDSSVALQDVYLVTSIPTTGQNVSFVHTPGKTTKVTPSPVKVKPLHVFKNPKHVAPAKPAKKVAKVASSAIKKKKPDSVRSAGESPLISGQGRYRFECDQCDAAFRHEGVLTVHKSTHGGPPPECVNSIYKCPGCLLILTSVEDLFEHIDRHKKPLKPDPNDQSRVACVKCNKCFPTESSMQLHYRQTHADGAKKEPMECEVCHKMLKSLSAYVSHKKVHDGSSDFFRCAVCLTNFRSGVELQEHSLSHCTDGHYFCTICERGYSTFSTLSAHLKSVHADKKCVCEICGYAFVDKNRLRRHMVTHSNDFNFKCDECEQMFKHVEHLNRHKRRVHNPEKPGTSRRVRIFDGSIKPRSSEDYTCFVYKCVECKLGFHQKKLLTRHLEDRHPERDPSSIPELTLPTVKVKAFPCRHCKRQFMTQDGLVTHLKKEHGIDRPESESDEDNGDGVVVLPEKEVEERRQRRGVMLLYCCTVCDLRFWSAGKLIKHAQSKHPGVDIFTGS